MTVVNLISTCIQQYIQAQVPLLWYNIDTNNEFFFSLATIPTIFNPQLSSFDLLFFSSLVLFVTLIWIHFVKEKKNP